jgi:hypothetical protein
MRRVASENDGATYSLPVTTRTFVLGLLVLLTLPAFAGVGFGVPEMVLWLVGLGVSIRLALASVKRGRAAGPRTGAHGETGR